MDPVSFGRLVAQAVPHIYDYPYLETHPLGRVLVPEPSAGLRGRALQQILLDGIEALKPPPETAESPHAWRTYRYVFLRFVQALPTGDVARELAISERQTHRTYRRALDALASILWDRYHRDAGQQSALAQGVQYDGDTLIDQEVRSAASVEVDGVTDLAEVIDGLRSIAGPLAEGRGCAWQTELEPSLPHLQVSRTVVRQLVLGLSALAIERAPGSFRLGARSNAQSVLIAVELAPTEERVDQEASQPGAQDGARLAILRRLAEAAGGELEVRRLADRGVRFVVSLPVAPRPIVLVIDDNPDVVFLLRRYMETAGLEVLEATGGVEGLRLASTSRPAAITLDVMMATQDGWETLQKLKNRPQTRDVPVLVCSVLREEALARFLGAAEFLPKPVARPQLLAALARCGLAVPAGEPQSCS